MDKLLLSMARVAGIAGALLVALAGTVRVTGRFVLGGVEVGTLLIAGMAAMVFACVCFLAVLTNRSHTKP